MKSLSRIGLPVVLFIIGWLLFIIFYPSITEEAMMSQKGNPELRATIGSQTQNSIKEICWASEPYSRGKLLPPSNFRVVSVRKSTGKSHIVHP